MKLMRAVRSAGLAAMLLALYAPIVSADGGPGVGQTFLTTGLSYVAPDDSRAFTPDFGYTLGIGRMLTSKWGAEFSHTRSYHDFTKVDGDGDYRIFQINGLAMPWRNMGPLAPYLTGGIGFDKVDQVRSRSMPQAPVVRRATSDISANFGVGAFMQITPGLRARMDARTVYGVGKGDIDGIFTVGLTMLLNGVSTPTGPMDSDGDGVMDPNDLCPNTPAGVTVDATGCPPVAPAAAPQTSPTATQTGPAAAMPTMDVIVEFDFDSAKIRSIEVSNVDRMVAFLKQHGVGRVSIEGHTDSIGTTDYNNKLSLRRAEAVRAYLVANTGSDKTLLKVRGYGETRPRASNDTAEGRQRNRRVAVAVMGDH